MVRNTVKLDSFDVRLLLLENEATFPQRSISLYKNVWKIMDTAPADCYRRRIWLVRIEALLLAVLYTIKKKLTNKQKNFRQFDRFFFDTEIFKKIWGSPNFN